MGQGCVRAWCASHTGAQYWFFLRKVVCENFRFPVLSSSGGYATSPAVATAQNHKPTGSLLSPAASVGHNIELLFCSGRSLGAGRTPVDNRSAFQASGARSLSRVASGHFARKTGGASPCTGAHTPDRGIRTRCQCIFWQRVLIFVDRAYGGQSSIKFSPARHQIVGIAALKLVCRVLIPGVTRGVAAG